MRAKDSAAKWSDPKLDGTVQLQAFLQEYKTALRRSKKDASNPVWLKDAVTAAKYYAAEYAKLTNFDQARFPAPSTLKVTSKAKDSVAKWGALLAALLAWYEGRQNTEEQERNQRSDYDLTKYKPKPRDW